MKGVIYSLLKKYVKCVQVHIFDIFFFRSDWYYLHAQAVFSSNEIYTLYVTFAPLQIKMTIDSLRL